MMNNLDDYPPLPDSGKKPAKSPPPRPLLKKPPPATSSFVDENSWECLFDSGDQIDDECLPALLSGTFTIQEVCPVLYDKLFLQKTIVLNLYDLYRYMIKTHPELVLQIATAPGLPSSGGVSVIKRSLQVLVKQHSFSRILAFAFVVFVSIADENNPKVALSTSFVCYFLPLFDRQGQEFLQSCCDGLSAETIKLTLQGNSSASLWGSPGIARLSPEICGLEAAGLTWLQLCQALCTVLCFENDDFDSLHRRCCDIINPRSIIFNSFRRTATEPLLTMTSKFHKVWNKLAKDTAAKNASDRMPSRLDKADCALAAALYTKPKEYKQLVMKRLRDQKIFRNNVTAELVLAAVFEVELENERGTVNDLCDQNEPFELYAEAELSTLSLNNNSSLSANNNNALSSRTSAGKTDYDALMKANMAKGAIVFTDRNQCRHCGLKGENSLPHDLKKCCETNPCLNCGSSRHKHIATTFCSRADPEHYAKNKNKTPLLPERPASSIVAPTLASSQSDEKPSDAPAVDQNDDPFNQQSAAGVIAAATTAALPAQPVLPNAPSTTTSSMKELGPPVQKLQFSMPWSGQYRPGVYASIVHSHDSDSDDDAAICAIYD